MNVAIIGTGYVGLVTRCLLGGFRPLGDSASTGGLAASTRCVAGRFRSTSPVWRELVSRNAAAGRLRFSTDLGDAVRDVDRRVPRSRHARRRRTAKPTCRRSRAVAADLADHLDGYRVIVTKSTVPVGTGAWLNADPEVERCWSRSSSTSCPTRSSCARGRRSATSCGRIAWSSARPASARPRSCGRSTARCT